MLGGELKRASEKNSSSPGIHFSPIDFWLYEPLCKPLVLNRTSRISTRCRAQICAALCSDSKNRVIVFGS